MAWLGVSPGFIPRPSLSGGRRGSQDWGWRQVRHEVDPIRIPGGRAAVATRPHAAIAPAVLQVMALRAPPQAVNFRTCFVSRRARMLAACSDRGWGGSRCATATAVGARRPVSAQTVPSCLQLGTLRSTSPPYGADRCVGTEGNLDPGVGCRVTRLMAPAQLGKLTTGEEDLVGVALLLGADRRSQKRLPARRPMWDQFSVVSRDTSLDGRF